MLEETLNKLKTKYPEVDYRVLRFSNTDLNFTMSMFKNKVSVLINGVWYKGVSYTELTHSWVNDEAILTLIVDIETFRTSSTIARQLISQYEIDIPNPTPLPSMEY
ncbi:hypothetical protein FC40_GL000687 [Ligilactobacillus hayakitensis DSM 18933 = JCM 14209]|uniref:Uncharacterized protein n=1 Tax=Ligilactobacillus hayakitensis DSM 18933 = JCM 14209 TaxID=1423755 RepID=A0A0R1WV49_9LACO|nr:hypothetical protein [Ligilactobacillus hayakitensis]KRM18899.1 hypothetical protein FC40_GL000687 [Ligilactobacillus hayakitensis DSM 18933 = JCM 14209]